MNEQQVQVKQSSEQTPTAQTCEQTRNAPAFVPAVDIAEYEDRLEMYADMPGVQADALDIDFEGGALSVRGCVTPRQDQNTNYLVREYGVGDFERQFRVRQDIDADNIEATLSNGVLHLTLPKSKEALPRRIQVKSA